MCAAGFGLGRRSPVGRGGLPPGHHRRLPSTRSDPIRSDPTRSDSPRSDPTRTRTRTEESRACRHPSHRARSPWPRCHRVDRVDAEQRDAVGSAVQPRSGDGRGPPGRGPGGWSQPVSGPSTSCRLRRQRAVCRRHGGTGGQSDRRGFVRPGRPPVSARAQRGSESPPRWGRRISPQSLGCRGSTR